MFHGTNLYISRWLGHQQHEGGQPRGSHVGKDLQIVLRGRIVSLTAVFSMSLLHVTHLHMRAMYISWEAPAYAYIFPACTSSELVISYGVIVTQNQEEAVKLQAEAHW